MLRFCAFGVVEGVAGVVVVLGLCVSVAVGVPVGNFVGVDVGFGVGFGSKLALIVDADVTFVKV